jgi:hypothetical protein
MPFGTRFMAKTLAIKIMINPFIETVKTKKNLLIGLLIIMVSIPLYIHFSLDEPYIKEAHRYLRANFGIEQQFGEVTGVWTNTESARWSTNQDSLTMWFAIDTKLTKEKGILVRLRYDSTWIAYDHMVEKNR